MPAARPAPASLAVRVSWQHDLHRCKRTDHLTIANLTTNIITPTTNPTNSIEHTRERFAGGEARRRVRPGDRARQRARGLAAIAELAIVVHAPTKYTTQRTN